MISLTDVQRSYVEILLLCLFYGMLAVLCIKNRRRHAASPQPENTTDLLDFRNIIGQKLPAPRPPRALPTAFFVASPGGRRSASHRLMLGKRRRSPSAPLYR